LEPITRFGVLPFQSPPTRWRQRHFSASPPSITASLDPIVDTPVALCGSSSRSPSAWKRSATIDTHRASMAAVAGYSSLSIMFLSNASAISVSASGSIQVVTKVARFSLAFPSSISSSRMICAATSGCISPSGR
jgi:hypothetical protein